MVHNIAVSEPPADASAGEPLEAADAASGNACSVDPMVDDSADEWAAADPFPECSIDRCGSCGTRINLRSPGPDAQASAWLCRRCGSVFFARCQEQDGRPFSAGIRQVSYFEVMKAINVHMQGSGIAVSRRDVERLVHCLAARPYGGREIRKQKRHHVAIPVTAVPLGADFRVASQPARMMTINISGGGAAVVHSRRVTEPYLVIDFAAAGVDLLPVVLQVTRVRTLASAFEIAGKFLSRIQR